MDDAPKKLEDHPKEALEAYLRYMWSGYYKWYESAVASNQRGGGRQVGKGRSGREKGSGVELKTMEAEQTAAADAGGMTPFRGLRLFSPRAAEPCRSTPIHQGTRMLNFFKKVFRGGSSTPLDTALVARIVDKLKIEPSGRLREVLLQGVDRGGNWSAESVEAARLILDQRSKNLAPEPVYRTVPRAAQDQSSREREAVAPGFSRRLLALDVGSRVYCRWRGQIGTIIRWQDEEERFFIRYDNGEGEWATLGMFE